MELWNNLEGSMIEGRYPLRKLVRSEGRCAWFETDVEAKPAIISLTESLNDQDSLLARLHAASELRHPNVIAIEHTGVTAIQGEPLVYAVAEYTEENLADVLRGRALSTEEARPLLDGMLAGLSAIHGKKLIQGRMEASSVLAVGDTIKLRSDCIQRPASDAVFAPLAAEDVRGVGSILFFALTQRRTNSASDPAIPRLASPFSQVVRRALSGQATVEEINALLQAENRPAAIPAVPAQPVKPAVRQPEPAVERRIPAAGDLPARRNGYYVVAALVVVLAIVGWLLHAVFVHHVPADTPASAPVSNAAVATPAPSSVATATSPSTETPVPSPAPPQAAPASTPAPAAMPGQSWRVVAYTYNRQDQAQHKADIINKRYPNLQAVAFSPHGGSPWLVTLGGGPMDRTQAIHLRLKALKMGLARDTYARNYRQ